MSATCNLDTFGLSTLSLQFNSMAAVDGVLVGLDANGAFALDAADDEGIPLPVDVVLGWTDGTGVMPDKYPTHTMKRVKAVYAEGIMPESLSLQCATANQVATLPVRHYHRGTNLTTPVPARVIPPKGLKSVWWQFGFKVSNTKKFRLSRVFGTFLLSQRRV